MNILLVEDNEVDVDLMRRGLRKLDIQGGLLRAKDGIDALEILRSQPASGRLPHPFVIILDINMPRMNGHEFLDNLRKTPELAHNRVIVFSTSENPKDIQRAYEKNAIGYVVKPDSAMKLRAALLSIWEFWKQCAHPPLQTHF